MSDPKHARMMIALAQRDLKALGGMEDAETFADEIFGFHAQQAVEKAIKAWISLIGVEYPLTHDTGALLSLLRDHHCDVKQFSRLTRHDAFAVELRYRFQPSPAEPLDRPATLKEVRELVEHVEKIIRDAEAAE